MNTITQINECAAGTLKAGFIPTDILINAADYANLVRETGQFTGVSGMVTISTFDAFGHKVNVTRNDRLRYSILVARNGSAGTWQSIQIHHPLDLEKEYESPEDAVERLNASRQMKYNNP